MAIPLRITHTDVHFEDTEGQEIENFKSIHHRNETLVGLSDIPIAVVIYLLSGDVYWSVSPGVSIPVGNVESDPFVLGAQGKDHQHIFFGNGTWVPQIKTDLNWKIQPDLSLGLSGNVNAPFYASSEGYRGPVIAEGGSIIQKSNLFYGIGGHAGVSLFREWPAEWNGKTARNSGRTDLLLRTGLNRKFGDKIPVHLAVQIPVWRDIEGGQLKTPLILSLGLDFTLF